MFTVTTTYQSFSQHSLGRFLSPDPYGQFYSAYTGMGNNPVNLVDPSGGWVDGEVVVSDEMPWNLKDAANVIQMHIALKQIEYLLKFQDANPGDMSFYDAAWIMKWCSPISEGGGSGNADGSISVSSSSGSQPTNNSGSTNEVSTPLHVYNIARKEPVPDEYGTMPQDNTRNEIFVFSFENLTNFL